MSLIATSLYQTVT